jgi:hypothetical protein
MVGRDRDNEVSPESAVQPGRAQLRVIPQVTPASVDEPVRKRPSITGESVSGRRSEEAQSMTLRGVGVDVATDTGRPLDKGVVYA